MYRPEQGENGMRTKQWVFSVLAIVGGCLLTLAACEPTQTLTIASDAALDGWVQSDGYAEANGGGPGVGDVDGFKPGIGHRQFYSFGLSEIPASATIVRATLNLYLVTVLGDPFGNHGVVLVDHLDYGGSLDGADYGASALDPAIGTIADDPTIEYKTMDVTSELEADLAAARSRTQFRLRFSILDTDDDGVNDYVAFTDAEDSCKGVNKPPHLLVEYK
jgi:hypothetical protein